MTDTLCIALTQINPTVGDVVGNVACLRRARADAAAKGADLVVSSELVVSGYPPEDLVVRPVFQDTVEREIGALATETADGGPGMLIGAPWIQDGKLYNAALLLDDGGIAAVRLKHDLPNYGVFDEKRVFEIGPLPGPISKTINDKGFYEVIRESSGPYVEAVWNNFSTDRQTWTEELLSGRALGRALQAITGWFDEDSSEKQAQA